MRDKKQKNKGRGFTLIELLIVIAVIAILAAVVFVALDPAKRFGEARDSTRWSDVNSILNAVLKYQVDHTGTLPTGIDSNTDTVQLIGEDSGGTACDTATPTCTGQSVYSTTASGCYVDLSDILVDEYLAEMIMDPESGNADDTRYYINKSENGRITVGACDYEETTTSIEVKR